MAERNPTVTYRNIHAHGSTQTPKVCKHCWRTLSFEAAAAKAATEFTNPGSGEGALLGRRRLPTSPAILPFGRLGRRAPCRSKALLT